MGGAAASDVRGPGNGHFATSRGATDATAPARGCFGAASAGGGARHIAMNPFDWRGPLFLFFYAAMLASGLWCARRLVAWLESGHAPMLGTRDPYLIAYLRA